VIDEVQFDRDGLVPVIAQDDVSGQVLMFAWMNRDALTETVKEGKAVYFSRSRQKLWRKGESSGNTQTVKSLQLDCDGDVILMRVEQKGGIACHTGRAHCFYRTLEPAAGSDRSANESNGGSTLGVWEIKSPVLKDPEEIYGKS